MGTAIQRTEFSLMRKNMFYVLMTEIKERKMKNLG